MNNIAKEHSDRIVKRVFDKYINDGNYMGFQLLYYGKGPYLVESSPGSGHNYYYILDSIYKYAKESRNENINNIFEFSLDHTIKNTFYPKDLNLCTNYLITEMSNEAKGISPFNIDIHKLFELLKNRVESYEMLKNAQQVDKIIKDTEEHLNNIHSN